MERDHKEQLERLEGRLLRWQVISLVIFLSQWVAIWLLCCRLGWLYDVVADLTEAFLDHSAFLTDLLEQINSLLGWHTRI